MGITVPENNHHSIHRKRNKALGFYIVLTLAACLYAKIKSLHTGS